VICRIEDGSIETEELNRRQQRKLRRELSLFSLLPPVLTGVLFATQLPRSSILHPRIAAPAYQERSAFSLDLNMLSGENDIVLPSCPCFLG
jgi:hypothetical protein